MVRNRAGNNKYLKQLNQKVILDLIRTNKTVSKIELSEITGLSPTAVGVIASCLMDKGYIHESGTGESKGGRRPVLLELKPRSFYSLGIDVDVDYIKVILIDITSEIVYEELINIEEPLEQYQTFDILYKTITEVSEKCAINPEKLLGIGVSVPGLVDTETNNVVLAPNLGWRNVDVVSYLSKAVGIPVFVENEAMASAISENWVGACQGINDFVCININTGIGAGIFIHGKPYRGVRGSAGEVGHIVVDENGPKCGCGNFGCLETFSSTVGIVEKAKRIIRQGAVSQLNDTADIDCLRINQIIQFAKSGDALAGSILAESARYLGIAISSIVNTLNPSKIILGKEFVNYADLVMTQIKDVVTHKALEFPASKVEILASDIGGKSSALGAAILPLKALFGK